MANLYIWVDDHEKLDSSIRKLHRIAGYFPEGRRDSDPVRDMLEWVLPHGMPLQLLAANTSLVPNQDARIMLALRPVLGVGRNWPFPTGRSLGLRGYWPRATPSPVFLLEEVFEISDSPPKEFESLLDVIVYQVDPRDNRQARTDNVLNNSLAEALPPISLITQRRLTEWSDFLAWKRKLVQANSLGLRYTGRKWKGDDSLAFDVVAENLEVLSACQKGIARDDLYAFPLEASEDPWTYRIPTTTPKGRQRKFEMGRVKGTQKLDGGNRSNPDWGNEVRTEVVVDLSNDDLDQLSNAEAPSDARGGLLEQIPEEGFLSISRAGDLSLIRRHEQAVQKLQTQGGYSPYLAAYLFDVKCAQSSLQLPTLSNWFNDRLNDSQKIAVQKMLAAQDLCMLQGPPGTGKTTVIAEAILQAVSRGETVLLASQAHTAVDNALGRLNSSPNVRAIRLGQEGKVTAEGKAFVQSGSLKRYYQSLENHASQRYLTRWADSDAETARCSAWCEKADYALMDCTDAQQKLNAHALESAALTSQRDLAWQTLQSAAQQQAEQETMRHILTGLAASVRAAIAGESPEDAQVLPGNLHGQAEALLQEIMRLAVHGIDLKSSWTDWPHLHHQRSQTLNLGLRDWLGLRLQLPRLRSDVARLQAARTDTLQDPQTRLKQEALESQIEALLHRLEAGEDVAGQWRASRVQLNALKQNTTNALDVGLYRRLFVDAEQLLAPGSTAAELASRLTARLAAVEAVGTGIEKDAGCLLIEIEQRIAAIPNAVQADELPWKTADQILKNHSAQQDRLESLALTVEAKAECLLDQQLVDPGFPAGSVRPSIVLSEQIARVRAQLLERQSARDEENVARTAWQPILAAWVADLAGADAPARDWEVMGHEWPRLCNVVAITCNERDATLEEIGQTGFDMVIVDEVSKATPLELLLPLMRARRAVLVGDHRQLPPLFQEGTDAVTFADAVDAAEESAAANSALTPDNLKRFERMVTASLFKEHFEGADVSIRARLNVQFRMHPQIMDLVNHFYERQLSCGLKDPDRERAHPFTLLGAHGRPLVTPKDHVLWVDTSRDLHGNICSEDLDAGGRPMRSNRMEAELIAHMLVLLNAQAALKGYSPQKKLEVGVVSFYAGQNRSIKKALDAVTKNGQFDCLDVEINTVIRYQGKEKEVIFISLVRNDGRDPARSNGIAPRRSSRANVARYEFINVALSRAKSLLVAMGARSMFETYEVKLPNMDGPGHKTQMVYRHIFDQLQRDAHMCEARDVMHAPSTDRPPVQRRQGAWVEGRRR